LRRLSFSMTWLPLNHCRNFSLSRRTSCWTNDTSGISWRWPTPLPKFQLPSPKLGGPGLGASENFGQPGRNGFSKHHRTSIPENCRLTKRLPQIAIVKNEHIRKLPSRPLEIGQCTRES